MKQKNSVRSAKKTLSGRKRGTAVKQNTMAVYTVWKSASFLWGHLVSHHLSFSEYLAFMTQGWINGVIEVWKHRPHKRNSSRKVYVEAVYIAYNMEMLPIEEQQEWFVRAFGCCRFLWNRMLADWKKSGGTKPPYTPAWYKKQYPWLFEPDSLALANVQLNLEAAISDYLKGEKGKPRFKKKYISRDSYKTNNQKNTVMIDGGHIRLPKIGQVKLIMHRSIRPGGILKNATVSREPDGRWMCSVVFEYPAEGITSSCKLNDTLAESLRSCAVDESIRIIGLDMSLPHLYVDSNGGKPAYTLDGTTIAFDKHYRKLEKRIAAEQRKLSRMKKHSHNYEKQARKVAKLHAKAKHQRHDFLRQMAIRLARSYDIIGIEDLDMRALRKSLKFGRSVSDNGWGLFTQYLEEDCAKTGSLVIRVDKWSPSSKTCIHCGHVHHELTLNDRTFICPVCGHVMDRDEQAGINIRNEALRIFNSICTAKPKPSKIQQMAA